MRCDLNTLACALLLCGLPLIARSEWNVGAAADVRHDDNAGNAASAADIVGDSILGARLSLFQLFPIGGRYSLTLAGGIAGEHYDRLDGLSNASVSAKIAVKRKWGLGAFVPWARIEGSFTRAAFDDAYRNAWIYRGAISTGRRLDERWNLTAEYAFERRACESQPREVPGLSGDAFSQSSHNLAATVEYSWLAGSVLTLGLLLRHGDVVSTTQASLRIFASSRALAEDPAFGSDAYAYRLDGTTVGFKLGISYPPTPHSSIGIDFRRFETHADGGNDYGKSLPEITWNTLF
jgi:hypothetical protein